MSDISGKPTPGNYTLCTSPYPGAARSSQTIEVNCDPGVIGQYVWIQVPGAKQLLTLCEVEVYAGW